MISDSGSMQLIRPAVMGSRQTSCKGAKTAKGSDELVHLAVFAPLRELLGAPGAAADHPFTNSSPSRFTLRPLAARCDRM